MAKKDEKDFVNRFGANLKRLRLEKGLTQEELANDADIPINQVGRIERGDINTSIGTAYRLSKALGSDILTLFDL